MLHHDVTIVPTIAYFFAKLLSSLHTGFHPQYPNEIGMAHFIVEKIQGT